MSGHSRRESSAGSLSEQKTLFLSSFESEVEFYQLFLLLVDKSCPIKRIDVVWADDAAPLRFGMPHRSKTAVERCEQIVGSSELDQPFCNLINGRGAHQAETCSISDHAAELRLRQTGKASVYQCMFGLTETAVPVIADGQYIATLFAGQVASEAPSEERFVQIRSSVEHLKHVDPAELEKAYWKVPVVTREGIEHTITALEMLAKHLASSWKRMNEMVSEQRQQYRELRLSRKEFAYSVLEGKTADNSGTRDLMRRIGFKRYPNRAMTISVESEESYTGARTPYLVAFSRALDAAERVCDSLSNVCCAYLYRGDFCVFFWDREEASAAFGSHARSLARKILSAVSAASEARGRIGIGTSKSDWRFLTDSYHEASVALTETSDQVAIFHKAGDCPARVSELLAQLCALLAERKLAEARRILHALPLAANQEIGSHRQDLAAQHRTFSFAIAKISQAAMKLVGDMPASMELIRELAAGPTVFELQQAFLRAGEQILDWIQAFFAGRQEKLIDLVRRYVEQALERESTACEINIGEAARLVGISPNYLTRIMRRQTGLTFERYVMEAKVKAAQRALLDPLATVAAVSARSGFRDSAYFTRVFRQVTGCSPSEYRLAPARFSRSGAVANG